MSHSYPLLNIPLPGTIPTKIILPYEHQTTIKSPTILANSDETAPTGLVNATHEQPPFPWANSDPFVYIQQIVLRSSVLPWRKNLLLTDAYRGPLHEIFKLLEIVRNHEEETSKTNLANICLHVENVKKPTKHSSIFPEYNCLILSPANLWQQNAQNFKKDTNLLSTIFHHHVSTAEWQTQHECCQQQLSFHDFLIDLHNLNERFVCHSRFFFIHRIYKNPKCQRLKCSSECCYVIRA